MFAVFRGIGETDLGSTSEMNLIIDSRYGAMFSKHSVICQGGRLLNKSQAHGEIIPPGGNFPHTLVYKSSLRKIHN
jgi:hypothetical protein